MKSQNWLHYLNSNMFYSFQRGIYQYLFLTLILIGSSSGGLKSIIICRFSGNGHNVFWTGEFVEGTIKLLNNDNNDSKLKSIDAQLIGEFVYKTRAGKSTTTHRKTFFKKILILRSDGDQNNFLLTYGDHVWPFRFLLNDLLPSSLEQTSHDGPYVHYFLSIVFVRPEWYRSNNGKTFPVVVKHASPPVNVTQLEEQKTNRKGVYLQVILHNSAVNAGKNFSFAVDVRNPKRYLIRRISVKLVQIRRLGPTRETQSNLTNRDLEKIHQFRDTNFHENFQLFVPHTVPPTFSFHSSSYDTVSLILHYELHFEAHLRGFFTNIRLQLPLIVTNHPENNWQNVVTIYKLQMLFFLQNYIQWSI